MDPSANTPAPAPSEANADREALLYGSVFVRVVPLLFLGYVVAYLNRVNVGFAKLQMLRDLGFSDTVYGFGAGIFFVGYALFEVPSNLLLHRFGARVWLARIMITWGLVSAATLFVRSAGTYYTLRLALGLAEAGFFPGVILFLTQWFPARLRARTTAYFIAAIAFSGVIGGPLSGWIMDALAGRGGLAGWQWLFLLEAIPSLVVGLLFLVLLPNSPADAHWLGSADKETLVRALAAENEGKGGGSPGAAFRHPVVWLYCLIYFSLMIGLYGVGFWLPTILKEAGVSGATRIGLLSAIPYAMAAVVMVVIGHRSDVSGSRKWPCIGCFGAAAVGFALIACSTGHTSLALSGLVLATCGVLGAMPLFWTFPAGLLAGAGAATGIAIINSVGNIAGFISPWVVGALNDGTHSSRAGLLFVAGMLALGAGLLGKAVRR